MTIETTRPGALKPLPGWMRTLAETFAEANDLKTSDVDDDLSRRWGRVDSEGGLLVDRFNPEYAYLLAFDRSVLGYVGITIPYDPAEPIEVEANGQDMDGVVAMLVAALTFQAKQMHERGGRTKSETIRRMRERIDALEAENAALRGDGMV